jgi:hypothetical protein
MVHFLHSLGIPTNYHDMISNASLDLPRIFKTDAAICVAVRPACASWSAGAPCSIYASGRTIGLHCWNITTPMICSHMTINFMGVECLWMYTHTAVCMCGCTAVCAMYICMDAYVLAYTQHTCICTSYIYVHMHVYPGVWIWIYIYICMWIREYVHVYLDVCAWIYIGTFLL